MPTSISSPSKDISQPAANGPMVRHAPIFIAATYVVVSLAWILFSDQFAAVFVGDGSNSALTQVQTYKGFFFVLSTGIFLYILVGRNVRVMRQSQADMRRQLEGIARQYQLLFQNSPSAMIIYEPGSLRILAINDVGLLLFGYSREEMLAMTCFDILVEEEKARAQANADSPQGGAQNHGSWQCRRRDRRIIFVDVVTHQVDFDGAHAGIVLMVDVTERLRAERSLEQHRSQLEQRVAERTAELSLTNRKLRAEVVERQRIEAELRAATLTAESANTAKSTFLANTSHEIRTPLTSILGYADLLADETLSPDERGKYLGIVQQNAQHLLALIDDLLDLSRAEMGKVRVVPDDHSPREIAQQAVELLRPRAADKALELTLKFEGTIPETIRTDGVRVRQVLLNLLSNAIKFTPRGQVSLTVRRGRPKCAPPVNAGDGATPRNNGDSLSDGICFEVCDTGIGLAAEHLERVFEPFYQVDQGVTRRYGGSGLGLSISQQLAIQMGGTLSVISTPGQGSTFTLLLPVPATPSATTSDEIAPANSATRALAGTILLAEDNPNIRLLVEEYLRRAGARVISTVDGAQAVDLLQQALAGGTPTIDLVLLDLHMPVMDGSEALRQMRLSGYDGPIVGLTADYAEKSTEQWMSEGWDAMAAKPIDRGAFIPILARMISQAAQQAQQQ